MELFLPPLRSAVGLAFTVDLKMSDIHERLLKSAGNMYAGAATAFETGRFYWAGITAATAVGVSVFLATDQETPEEIRPQAELIRKQAFALSQQARAAWFRQQSEARLSGRLGKREKDGLLEYIEALVREAIY